MAHGPGFAPEIPAASAWEGKWPTTRYMQFRIKRAHMLPFVLISYI